MDRKKYFVVTALVLITVIGGVAVLIYRHNQKPVGLQKTSTGYDVNLSPPTEEEKKDTEQKKKQLAEDQTKEPGTGSPSTPPSSGKTAKTPFIVFVGQEDQSVELTGYIPGIFEEGGTCTAAFARGTLRVTGQSKGFKDYNHTSCAPISIDRSEFKEAGDWQVTLSYGSTAATGISKASTVVVK